MKKESHQDSLFYMIAIRMFGNTLSNDKAILTNLSVDRPIDSLPAGRLFPAGITKKAAPVWFPTNPASEIPFSFGPE